MGNLLLHGTGIGAALVVLEQGILRGFTPHPLGRGVSLTRTPRVAIKFTSYGSQSRIRSQALRMAARQGLSWQTSGVVFGFDADKLAQAYRLSDNNAFHATSRSYEDETLVHGDLGQDVLLACTTWALPGALEAYASNVVSWCQSGAMLSRAQTRRVMDHAQAALQLARTTRPGELSDMAAQDNVQATRQP